MKRQRDVPAPEEYFATCLRVALTMPESRLTVVTNFLLCIFILALVFEGDITGWVGVAGVVAINGVTSKMLYDLGKTLEEVENRQGKQ